MSRGDMARSAHGRPLLAVAADEFGDLPFALAAIAPKKPALTRSVPKGAWRKARDVLTNLFFWVARIDD